MGSGSVLLPKLYDSPATCASSDEGASRAAIVNGNATTFALARGCDSGTGTLDTTGRAARVVDGAGATEGEEKDGVAALRASGSSHAGIFTSSSCSPLTLFSVFAFNVASCDETGFCCAATFGPAFAAPPAVSGPASSKICAVASDIAMAPNCKTGCSGTGGGTETGVSSKSKDESCSCKRAVCLFNSSLAGSTTGGATGAVGSETAGAAFTGIAETAAGGGATILCGGTTAAGVGSTTGFACTAGETDF